MFNVHHSVVNLALLKAAGGYEVILGVSFILHQTFFQIYMTHQPSDQLYQHNHM